MKRSFIPLLLASVIILTSMSDCVKEEDRGLVSLDLDGRTYSRQEPIFYFRELMYANFRLEETSFLFTISETFPPYEGDEFEHFILSLSLNEDEPFELYRRYPLGEDNSGRISLVVPTGVDSGTSVSFSSQDGYVEFTEYDGEELSGKFEFTAVNHETDSIVYVTNGVFENIPKHDW